MPTLDKLASALGTREEAPNVELAKQIASAGDAEAVSELVAGLKSRDKAIRSDCVKTLYEIGYLKPELLSDDAGAFLDLLRSRDNRLVWGGMISLAAVARGNANEVRARIGEVYAAMERGSVITVDNGVRVLAAVAAQDPGASGEIVAYLLEHVRTCRPSSVPQHAESALPAANALNKSEFIKALEYRGPDMTPAQLSRLRKIYKALERL